MNTTDLKIEETTVDAKDAVKSVELSLGELDMVGGGGMVVNFN